LKIQDHRELLVYQKAFAAALRVFDVSESFPKKEMFSLTDQARRSSRSVCANLAEAWRKRRYEAAFIAKLNDAETEAAETQVWVEFAVHHRYLEAGLGETLHQEYNEIIRIIVSMINHPENWIIAPQTKPKS
jgi:four helix bundle protein